jgi:hypothetical protein
MKKVYYPPQQQLPAPINHGNGIIEQYVAPEDAFTTNIGFLKDLAPTYAEKVRGNTARKGNYGATGISGPQGDTTLANLIRKGAFVNSQYSYIPQTSFKNEYLNPGQTKGNLTNQSQNQYKTKFAHSEREGYRDAVDQLIDQYYKNQGIVKPSSLSRTNGSAFEKGLDARYQLDRHPTPYRNLMNQNGHIINEWSDLQACQNNNSELGSGCSDWIGRAYPDNSQIGYIAPKFNELNTQRQSLIDTYNANQGNLQKPPQPQYPQQQQQIQPLPGMTGVRTGTTGLPQQYGQYQDQGLFNQMNQQPVNLLAHQQNQMWLNNWIQHRDQLNQKVLELRNQYNANHPINLSSSNHSSMNNQNSTNSDINDLQLMIPTSLPQGLEHLARGGRVKPNNPLLQRMMKIENNSPNPLVHALLGRR